MTTVPLHTIPVGQHVIIRLDGSALPATVVGSDGSELTFVLAAPTDRVPGHGGGEAAIEWSAGLGYRRCIGEVLERGDASELLRVKLITGPELVRSRRWPRVESVLGVTVALIDEPGSGGRTTTIDVGGGGILMNDPWRLRIGTGLRIAVDLGDGGPPVRALGQVVRQARADQTGVRFDDITDADRERLVRYVRDHERLRVESGIFRF